MSIDQRTELGQLITELWNGADEERSEEIADRANVLSPDPNWSDYIFHSEEFIGENETLLLEDLLEKIFSYKSIQL